MRTDSGTCRSSASPPPATTTPTRYVSHMAPLPSLGQAASRRNSNRFRISEDDLRLALVQLYPPRDPDALPLPSVEVTEASGCSAENHDREDLVGVGSAEVQKRIARARSVH